MLCTANKHCSQLCMAMLKMPCCVACVHAAFHKLCMLGCLGHTACAVPESLQQAYETTACFAQQTCIALSCVLQCWKYLLCGLHVNASFHMPCMLWFLSHTACAKAVLCLKICSKHIRQRSALHSRQALLSAVYCNAGNAALWPVSMLPVICSACWAFLVTPHVLCVNICSKDTRQWSALHSRQALLSAVHCSAEDALLCGLYECCPSYALYAVTSESHCMC